MLRRNVAAADLALVLALASMFGAAISLSEGSAAIPDSAFRFQDSRNDAQLNDELNTLDSLGKNLQDIVDSRRQR
jgi:hypothetical protein